MASELIVDSIIGRDQDGNNAAVIVSAGVSISGGTLVVGTGGSDTSGVNVSGVLTATNFNLNNVNLAGIITAAQFIGDGSNLTGLRVATKGNSIGLTLLK